MTLQGLPHQIPFRAISEVERSTSAGLALLSENGTGGFVSGEMMILEAMAQTAGATIFDAGQQGRLAGVDRFRIEGPVEAGDRVEVLAGAKVRLGELHRVEMTASRDGLRVASAVIYLSAPGESE